MVECFQTRKGFHLGIKDIFQEWYCDGKVWRVLTEDVKTSEDFGNNYTYGVADTSLLLTNWLQYLPGVIEWDTYGEMSVSFDMDEVAKAGWDEAKLVSVLEAMANKVNRCRTVKAYNVPWWYSTHDAWGSPINYWRYPALLPLKGMIDKDYPTEMETV